MSSSHWETGLTPDAEPLGVSAAKTRQLCLWSIEPGHVWIIPETEGFTVLDAAGFVIT